MIIGLLSLVVAFFNVRTQLVVPRLISLFLPFSLFGTLIWSFYFWVFDRFRRFHVHLMGSTGSGKSSLLLYLIYRDILKGNNGLAIIEPHSQLISHVLYLKILQLDHKSKLYKKVILLDFEDENPPALNLFAIKLPASNQKRRIYINAVVQNYLEAFLKGFGGEMPKGVERVLKNVLTVLFFLPGATIIDTLDILRAKQSLPIKYTRLFENIEDEVLKKYFEDDFFSSRSEISKEVLRLRLEHLLTDPQIKSSFSQKSNILCIDEALREGKIILVKAGRSLGKNTSMFIGALVFQLILFSGFKRIKLKNKKSFTIYLDECQNFMSQDICTALEELRKANISVVLSHQRSRQTGMSWDQWQSLNSCGVKIYGRIADFYDAYRISRQMLMPKLENRFVNLRTGEFYAKAGNWKARFIKIPKSFTLAPNLMGKTKHRMFAKEESVQKLIKYLKKKIRYPIEPKQVTPDKSKLSNYSIDYDL